MEDQLRNQRQSEFANKWLKSDRRNILLLAPRFGKIRVSLLIMEELKPSSVLICYPDNKIKQSWLEDFNKFSFSGPSVIFSTFLSLYKQQDKVFDLVIIDEIHLLSEAQIATCNILLMNNHVVLGLTGTLSSWTEKVLWEDLNLPVIARYSIETAIREGILPDYEINIVRVPLDNQVYTKTKLGTKITEKKRFSSYAYYADKLEKQGDPAFWLKLKMIRVLQSSIAKRNKTEELIEQFKEDRLLVFCGLTKIADSLGIPSYHSKSSEKGVWDDFVEGRSKHLAVVKIGQTGITFLPLNRVIINYFDSNEENMTQKIMRSLSLEYDNPDKKAIIYCLCSTEKTEEIWMNKALSMFSQDKIKVI
jgi:superfamily II DNA or RNA helicase